MRSPANAAGRPETVKPLARQLDVEALVQVSVREAPVIAPTPAAAAPFSRSRLLTPRGDAMTGICPLC